MIFLTGNLNTISESDVNYVRGYFNEYLFLLWMQTKEFSDYDTLGIEILDILLD